MQLTLARSPPLTGNLAPMKLRTSTILRAFDEAQSDLIGKAVVLTDGHDITERDLRAYLSDQLAAFKVPKRIVFVTEIPKGATGKPQRIGLAAKLDL